MSNRLFQGIIHQMGDAANRTIGVIDDTGVIIACSELVKIGEARHHFFFLATLASCFRVARGDIDITGKVETCQPLFFIFLLKTFSYIIYKYINSLRCISLTCSFSF